MSKMSLKNKIHSVTMNSVCSAIIVVILATLPLSELLKSGQMTTAVGIASVSSAEQDSQESAENGTCN